MVSHNFGRKTGFPFRGEYSKSINPYLHFTRQTSSKYIQARENPTIRSPNVVWSHLKRKPKPLTRLGLDPAHLPKHYSH